MSATSTPPVGLEAHFDPHDIQQEWTSDFYAYFEAPENASRYTPAIQFLETQFQSGYSVLDLACGSGTLLHHLPSGCRYLGIDHCEGVIARCRQTYPHRNFACQDVRAALLALATKRQSFDAVVLSGLLFNSVDRHTQIKLDDLKILQACEGVVAPGGTIVLVVPFVFSDHPDYGLMAQAEWKLQSIDRLLHPFGSIRLFQAMTVQIGLERRIAEQAIFPDWFIAPGGALDQASHWHGTFMGTWTIILEPETASMPKLH